MGVKRGFASDNNAGVHPIILEAIMNCNPGHVVGYGDDPYTREAIEILKNEFGTDCEAFFVYNGTAANVIGLKNMTHSIHSIICAETAHIEEDECGAPEFFTGCKLLPVPTKDGKLTPELVAPHIRGFGFEHHSQPRVVSITQATEMGTVYSQEEIRELADYVHQAGLYLHMDGARIANAAVAHNVSIPEMTRMVGVDVLSLGITKNGGMYGEAILFFTPGFTEFFKYYRKQGMQLASKMRYMAVQFTALFQDQLWYKNALHANEMARYLANQISDIESIHLIQPVESNGVFVQVPRDLIEPLQSAFFFYLWDEDQSIARWMTSWDTTHEDIDAFVSLIRSLQNTHHS